MEPLHGERFTLLQHKRDIPPAAGAPGNRHIFSVRPDAGALGNLGAESDVVPFGLPWLRKNMAEGGLPDNSRH